MSMEKMWNIFVWTGIKQAAYFERNGTILRKAQLANLFAAGGGRGRAWYLLVTRRRPL